MKITISITALFFFSFSVSAGGLKNKIYGNIIVDKITSVYDGDTFRVNIDGWPPIISERIAIRINNVDTPEMKGQCKKEIEQARKAKKFTVATLRSGKVIELRNIKRGKYFRIVADVFIDGENLGNALINKGLAYRYDGKKKKSWCENN